MLSRGQGHSLQEDFHRRPSLQYSSLDDSYTFSSSISSTTKSCSRKQSTSSKALKLHNCRERRCQDQESSRDQIRVRCERLNSLVCFPPLLSTGQETSRLDSQGKLLQGLVQTSLTQVTSLRVVMFLTSRASREGRRAPGNPPPPIALRTLHTPSILLKTEYYT